MSRWDGYGEAAWWADGRGGMQPSSVVPPGRLRLSDAPPRTLVMVARATGSQARQWLMLAGLAEGDRVRVLSGGLGGDRVVEADGRRIFMPARIGFETLVGLVDEAPGGAE